MPLGKRSSKVPGHGMKTASLEFKVLVRTLSTSNNPIQSEAEMYQLSFNFTELTVIRFQVMYMDEREKNRSFLTEWVDHLVPLGQLD